MGKEVDLIVTSSDMESQISGVKADVIYLKFMTNKQEIREKLLEYLKNKK